MPSARDDYIMRLITEAGAALRRLRSRVSDGDDGADVALEADRVIAALLGSQQPMLSMLDARSAAQIVGDEQRLALWIELLATKASALGQSVEGARVHARAESLRAQLPARDHV